MKSSKKLKIFNRDLWVCYMCYKDVDKTDATVDHIVPKALGGLSCKSNLMTCCRSCNLKRGKLTEAGLTVVYKRQKVSQRKGLPKVLKYKHEKVEN